MKTVDIHRFGNTVLWQIADRKRICLNIIAFGFLFAIIGALFNLITSGFSGDTSFVNDIAWIFISISSAYLLTCGAIIVGNISDKKRRISLFILPASKLEKFASRYIYILILVPLMALAGLAVGDLLQMSLYKILTGNAASIVYRLFCNLTIDYPNNTDIGGAFACFFCLWFIHSVFLLFGTFFRRRAWIKSIMLAVGITIVLGLVFTFSAKGILDLIYGVNNYNVVIIDEPWVTVVVCFVNFAFIAFNYWASYRIYARMQGVNTKWYNF